LNRATERRCNLTARVKVWAEGRTIADIADDVGVGEFTVWKWLHGRGTRDLHERTGEDLARAMGLVDENGRPDTEALYAPLG